MSRKNSFSARLSLNILIVTSIVFVLTLGIASVYSHGIVVEEATKSVEHLRDATILKIEKMLQKVESSVTSSVWLVNESGNDEEYLYHITRMIVEENPDIVGSAIAFDKNYFEGKYYFSPYSYIDSETGEIKSKQLGNQQYDYFYTDWFQIPYLMGEPCWSEPYYDDGGAEYQIATYSYPLKDENGKVYAILTADISLEWISHLMESVKPYPNSNVMVISRAGSFLSSGKDSGTMNETIFSTLFYTSSKDRNLEELAYAISRGETGSMTYTKGSRVSFAVFAPLSNGWKACISCDYKEVLSKTSKLHFILLIIGLFGLLVLFLLSYYTIRSLTRPLTDFTQSVLSVANGNFDAELPQIKNEDEIRRLRDSFEYMQKSIKDYIGELQTTTAAKQRMESELSIASQIQMAMLPTNFPHNEKVGLHAFVKPAKEVGGDLYDFFIEDDRYLYFTVGDVSGKGIPASLFMAITRAAFRFIAKMGLPMNEVVSKMNNALSESNDTGMFVTLFVGRIDLSTGDFTYCNAGHNPIVIVSPDGTAGFLKARPNLAAGLIEDFPYVGEESRIEKGSRIVLYTDGVTEAERADKEQYGEDRLIEWCHGINVRFENTEGASADLLSHIREFTAGNEQNDDITIMVINVR